MYINNMKVFITGSEEVINNFVKDNFPKYEASEVSLIEGYSGTYGDLAGEIRGIYDLEIYSNQVVFRFSVLADIDEWREDFISDVMSRGMASLLIQYADSFGTYAGFIEKSKDSFRAERFTQRGNLDCASDDLRDAVLAFDSMKRSYVLTEVKDGASHEECFRFFCNFLVRNVYVNVKHNGREKRIHHIEEESKDSILVWLTEETYLRISPHEFSVHYEDWAFGQSTNLAEHDIEKYDFEKTKITIAYEFGYFEFSKF